MKYNLPRHANTAFQRYFADMTYAERKAFAERVGLSVNSLKANYMRRLKKDGVSGYDPKKPTRCRPGERMMKRLAQATEDQVAVRDVIKHFYPTANV